MKLKIPDGHEQPFYTPERDGTLEEHLKVYNGISAFPLFKGFKQFKMLWEEGWFIPNFSVVRIMWNVGRGDEHYTVISSDELEGIDASYHQGKQGRHSAREIFGRKDCPCFEAQHLSHEHLEQKVINRNYNPIHYDLAKKISQE